jgi:hypothetical protein
VALQWMRCLGHKVEKIKEDSLDPSSSVKIQIIGGKVFKAKHCWVMFSNVLPLHLNQTFLSIFEF